MPENEDPEDPIFRLNNLRKRLEGNLRSADDKKKNDTPQTPEDTDSTAIEEYLTSRLQQIGEITPETKQYKGLRTGNGWDSDRIIEQGYKIEPIAIKRSVDIAISANRRLGERII
ncbi:MAG TPA: hypothetical protein VJZ32_05770, partial [Candidatus Bathyarchaeia archaeon]|nr:hypothetical protein [Candidatus Bathyarchaeia archaeon]